MKDYIYEFLSIQGSALTSSQVIGNFAVAAALSLIVFFAYRYSHTGAVYSARFNVSLIMLTVVTTLVMTVIGTNIALSLGMVGALSIVRFRTAIKDPRDTAFIFWGIAIGICCGVAEYFVASVGSAFLLGFLLLFGRIQTNERYLLIVRGNRAASNKVETTVGAHFQSKARLRVKNSTTDTVEFIYELTRKMLNAAEKSNGSISDKLYLVEGIHAVNLVCQNDEISG